MYVKCEKHFRDIFQSDNNYLNLIKENSTVSNSLAYFKKSMAGQTIKSLIRSDPQSKDRKISNKTAKLN